MNQLTIREPFSLAGRSLHSGKEVSLVARPAPLGRGLCFLTGGKKISALAGNVIDTTRGTSLPGVAVVEHFLSAVWSLGIDNLEVELSGDELPALDGSALPFCQALARAGIQEQPGAKIPLVVSQPIKLVDGEASIEIRPFRGFRIDFMVNFQGVGPQKLLFDLAKDDYLREIAPARTFGYLEEYESLKARGLALGASPENALVLGKDGYLSPPRFPDEPVRHKILDLLGDLALIGRPLSGEVRAVRSGHKLNVELARRLLKNG